MTARVLVVDDDQSIRETLEYHLRESGYDVTAAASAEQALSRIAAADPSLLITDVRMGGMSGLELLAKVRAVRPETDVLVITAFEDMQTAISAMKAGAVDYLVKPLDLDQIDLVIERCLRDQRARRRLAQYAADEAEPYALSQLVGRDAKMIAIYKTIGTLTRSRAPVLIRGETGTGKEVIARAIHFNSADLEEPFVAVNCTAVPEPLLESELFGHVRGSFTGAIGDRKGRFELAGRGTLFLDEIGDTSPAFQAKLLRVLQEREFYPVGGERPRRTEARVIAATHRDLERSVASGAFREDLYFRLRVVEIVVPPLRERRGDIAPLAQHLLAKAGRELHRESLHLAPDAVHALEAHDWPGNVRELENTLMRAVALSTGATIGASDLSIGASASSPARSGGERAATLQQVEREHVERVLRESGWNKRQACRILGVSRPRLDRLLERHGIVVTERRAT
ncbi:MAG TPA: sigma-54 dependent transcriptional regulator [Gemmatimonadaceae bacterium]|nr:sigma-54 dependent transcriptional regulator [Gemmatimonadaceae bacterium]